MIITIIILAVIFSTVIYGHKKAMEDMIIRIEDLEERLEDLRPVGDYNQYSYDEEDDEANK